MSEGPFIEYIHVDKSYDGKNLVVSDFNLEVYRSEFVTLLGPSGSGKTTCLMMLAGFEAVTRGKILASGTPIHRVPSYKRGIGVVFQHYALFPHMTVAENVAFPLQVRKLPRSEVEQRVAKTLEMVQLAGYAARRPRQLSGGQQQRVAVARALVFDPPLILMDEPLGALDKQLRHQMQYELKQLHRSLGVTVLYVTHDQSEALTMSNRVAILRNGLVEQIGSPEEIYERPATAFVAQFVGENNALSGTVVRVEGSTCCVRLVDGSEVWGEGVGIVRNGDHVLLSIRPERVRINANEDETARRADIRDVTYLGEQIRLRLSFGMVDNFIVTIRNLGDSMGYKVGQQVIVSWRTPDCRAFVTDGSNCPDAVGMTEV